jgi:CheY-like chemotaxis protein
MEPDMAEIEMERSLRFEGYEVVVAGDGAEALERVRQDRPDAVELDVLMPRVDGLEACRPLRPCCAGTAVAAGGALACADLRLKVATRAVRRGTARSP